MSKNTGKEAEEAVLGYMKSVNRPYSVNDVANNLQGKYTKAVITKAVDALVESGDLVEKTNGKQKYYFYSQEKIPLDEEKLREVEEKIKINDQEFSKLRAEIIAQEAKIKLLKQHVPIEDLEKRLEELKSVVSNLEEKASALTDQCQNIDPEKNATIKKKHQLYVNEWKRRKRMANEMFGMIHENASKPKKTLIEEIGIETDEENDAKMPN